MHHPLFLHLQPSASIMLTWFYFVKLGFSACLCQQNAQWRHVPLSASFSVTFTLVRLCAHCPAPNTVLHCWPVCCTTWGVGSWSASIKGCWRGVAEGGGGGVTHSFSTLNISQLVLWSKFLWGLYILLAAGLKAVRFGAQFINLDKDLTPV